MENSITLEDENKDDFSLKLQYSYISSTPQIIVGNDYTSSVQHESKFAQACRLCANVVDKATYLFANNENGRNLADEINSCLPITVKESDMLPKQLCSNCIEKLHECFQFSGACISAEKKLMAENIHSSNSDHEISTEEINFCNNNYSCPLCVEGTLQVVNNMMNNERESSTDQFKVKTDSSVNSDFIPNTHYRMCHDNVNINITSQITHEDDKFLTELCMIAEPNSKGTLQDLHNSNYICRICNKLFYTIEMIYSHCKSHCTYSSFPCVLCDNTYFNTESQLETHFSYSHHQFVNCNNMKEIDQRVNPYNELIITSSSDISNKTFLTDISFPVQLNEESSSVKFNSSSEILEEKTLLYSGYLVPETKKICEICGMHFSTDAMLLMHMNYAHTTNNELKSADHNNLFESPVFLNQCEPKEQTMEKSLYCEFCEATFNQLIQLQKHVKQFHVENCSTEMQICYQCSECNAIFPGMKQVSEHSSFHEQCTVHSHYVQNIFKCEYCDLCFLSREDLKHHLSQHIGGLPYECLQCNLHFESFYKVTEHKKTHENNSTICNIDQFSIPVHYLCEFCGRNFEQWQTLYIHRFKSHLHGRTLVSDQRTKNVNMNSNLPQDSGQSHLCEVCGMIFESHMMLTKHRKQEHPQTSKYQCPECGKVLANLTGLIIHRRLHTGEKPFVCDVCGKSFHQSSGMYTHRRTHTRECPYRCEYCGQAYNVKGDLDNHRRAKHTKERPFKCETCQKSFLTSSVFYQHRILHTGVRKYKCMYCEKSFARWNALRLHIRTHTGEKPYICFVCQRGFAQKGDMKKHMKTQHNVHEMPGST